MRPALAFLLLSFSLPAFAAEYTFELKVDPIPEPGVLLVFSLDPAPPTSPDTAPVPLAAEDRVFAGSFRLRPDHPELRVVLVEPAQGEPYLYADGDLDGQLTAEERFPLGDVLLKLPPSRFPVLLRPFPGPAPQDGSRRLLRSRSAVLEATVPIGMMEMLVR